MSFAGYFMEKKEAVQKDWKLYKYKKVSVFIFSWKNINKFSAFQIYQADRNSGSVWNLMTGNGNSWNSFHDESDG